MATRYIVIISELDVYYTMCYYTVKKYCWFNLKNEVLPSF